MSSITFTVYKEELPQNTISDELYKEYIKKFIVGLKSIFAEYVSENYDVLYETAMKIVRVRDTGLYFEIGLQPPELYTGKARQIVETLLKYDLGSYTEQIEPIYMLKKAAEDLSSSIETLWGRFITTRDRGDLNGE